MKTVFFFFSEGHGVRWKVKSESVWASRVSPADRPRWAFFRIVWRGENELEARVLDAYGEGPVPSRKRCCMTDGRPLVRTERTTLQHWVQWPYGREFFSCSYQLALPQQRFVLVLCVSLLCGGVVCYGMVFDPRAAAYRRNVRFFCFYDEEISLLIGSITKYYPCFQHFFYFFIL